MKILNLILFMQCAALVVQAQSFEVGTLLCEGKQNPVGIDAPSPRLSWILSSNSRNVKQQGYELRVAKDANISTVIWKTGKVNSDQSLDISYGGPALESKTRYYWQVRVTSNSKKTSAWSPVQFFETGFFKSSDWKAEWIQSTAPDDSVEGPAVRFRKAFTTTKKIASARAYVTAHGLYELHMNGRRVGEAYLTPGWTSYSHRLQYQVYDVTDYLLAGANVMGAELSSGWYRGNLGWADNKNVYGSKLALLLQLEVTYADGSTDVIVTDNSWACSTKGPTRSSEIYNGEVYDARMEQRGWTSSSFNESGWMKSQVADQSKEILIATEGPPVMKHEVFKPINVIKTPKGETVLDFGQNLVGWIQFTIKAKAGDKITIHHAEVLDKYGDFYIDNLRAAKQRIVYTCSGKDTETFEPHFTFFGFRYIKVEGLPGDIKPENFKAFALYSDMKPTGTFSCSNELINQLQHNIQWGQRGNFVDVPTDCPQRDERLGWTGDAQVFSNTAAYNMDVRKFFSKWLKDLAADQTENGRVPFVIPNVLGKDASASAGWADAGTIIPWNLYVAYGDKKFLEQQYTSMKAWVEFMHSKSEGDDLWNEGFHFGDWLFYRPFDDNDGLSAVTDKYLIAQAFYYNSVQLLKKSAEVLGKTEDVTAYTALGEKIKNAFQHEYITPSGRLVSGTQTAYVLALQFDLFPEDMRKGAADRLVQNIRSYHNHLTTGFLGTPYLCHVLSRYGHTDVAYELLLQPTYPSWLYPVKMGATTIWERWDGIKPDSTFQTPGMNSFNHYAYGAIGDWMYKTITGINTDNSEEGVGYKHSILKPVVGGGLTQASGELLTRYGKLAVRWKLNGQHVDLEVEIPANTTATLHLPTTHPESAQENGKPLANSSAITIRTDKAVVDLASGSYHFVLDR